MILTCVAIDDEPLALAKIQAFIESIPHLELRASFASCVEAIPFLTTQVPDILFLDIQMDHMTGIQLLENVKLESHVIITSAFESYALKGYELNVCDYMLKPFGIDRFIQGVEKVRQLMVKSAKEMPEKDYIFIKADYKIVKVDLKTIVYVEGMGDYLCMYTSQGKVMTSLNFSELAAKLPPDGFMRVHKSYLVNLSFIKAIEKHRIYIKDEIIPLSQTYRDDFYRVVNG